MYQAKSLQFCWNSICDADPAIMIPHAILKFKFLPLFFDLESWYNNVPQAGIQNVFSMICCFLRISTFGGRRDKISYLKSKVLLRKSYFSFSSAGCRKGVKVFISNIKPRFSMKSTLFNFVGGGGGWV